MLQCVKGMNEQIRLLGLKGHLFRNSREQGSYTSSRGNEGELYKLNKGDTYPKREEGEGKQS